MSPKKKNKKSANNYSFIIIIIFCAALAIFLMRWKESRRIKFIKYEKFGIEIPADYTIHGIDVSRYQQSINWEQVKEMNVENITIGFVFIKATEGENLIDPYFKYNQKEADKNNLTKGVYHFFSPDKDALQQAKFFIRNVDLKAGDLPPVLDIETIGNISVNVLKTKIKTWLHAIEAHYKVKPLIYTNADFYKKYLGNDFNDYPFWVAHYYENRRPRIDRDWIFWQHNDRGNVDGIISKVDFNVFNGDSIAFQKLLIK
jgi:lysozyme